MHPFGTLRRKQICRVQTVLGYLEPVRVCVTFSNEFANLLHYIERSRISWLYSLLVELDTTNSSLFMCFKTIYAQCNLRTLFESTQ